MKGDESMKEKGDKILIELYKFTIENGKSSAQINREDASQWREDLDTIRYLEEKGLLNKVTATTGFVVINLTAYGVDYVEGNLI